MKKRRSLISVAIVLIYVLIAGCTSDSGIPASLNEILDRNDIELTPAGQLGGGAGSTTSYNGNSAAVVKQLLGQVKGWKTPSCTTCSDGMPPKVNINSNCQRDSYVASAVNYAWAIESYYRLGETSSIASLVTNMNQSLQYARNLCGSSTVSSGSCYTLSIYGC
ncbi:hypothetical protein DSL64_05080 [Dyadobacter luteus]|uniref:Uncharacterized protein n=1 Tax=Dyadobacter luteus TaxID=2259619 RepID=A0A3D8YHB2_9BACT|nr:hypothetical protein [Dyadobacter luteus]REA63799.1 hypothetical protein DSL64_05080 [Dyadobacter luteus]